MQKAMERIQCFQDCARRYKNDEHYECGDIQWFSLPFADVCAETHKTSTTLMTHKTTTTLMTHKTSSTLMTHKTSSTLMTHKTNSSMTAQNMRSTLESRKTNSILETFGVLNQSIHVVLGWMVLDEW